MIGIIGAMKVEIEELETYMEQKEEKTIGSVRFVKGLLDGREIVAAVCGIGKVAASICAQTMIMAYAPDCIINTGVAGSLSEKAGICDTVIADTLVQHDMDITPLGDPPGMIEGLGIVDIPADEKVASVLKEAALQAAPGKVITGKIASGDQFVASSEKKDFIVNTFNAIACEMEGAAIAQTCYSAGVPFGVLRAISDNADGSAHLSYAEFLPEAASAACKTIVGFVKKYSR